MAAPSVQVSYNDMEIKVFWDLDITGAYVAFNLYGSFDKNMVGEAKVASNIPNSPDTTYSSKSVLYKFKREVIGAINTSIIYLRLKGVNILGVEDTVNIGAIKRIESLPEKLQRYRSAQVLGYDYNTNIWRKVKVASDGNLG